MIDLSEITFNNINISHNPEDEQPYLATIITENGVFAGFGAHANDALNAAVERQRTTDPEHGLVTLTVNADEISDPHE